MAGHSLQLQAQLILEDLENKVLWTMGNHDLKAKGH